MTFWRTLKATYRDSIALFVACPLLALIPVAFEIAQHAVEVRIGMYDSVAMAQAVEHHPLRMGFGVLKVASLLLAGYWVPRFLAWRDPRRAGRLDPPAVRLFAGFFAFQLAIALVQLFVLPQTGAVLLVTFLGGQIVNVLVVAWGIAAPLGNAVIGPRRSVAIMAPQLLWGVAFSLAAMLPLMIPHYAFAALALLGPRWALWPVMLIDSLLVGWLTAVLVAAAYHVALRGAERAGVTLTPA